MQIVRIPKVMQAAQNRFKRSILAADLDFTLIPTPDNVTTTLKGRPISHEISKYLSRQLPFTIITGSHIDMQAPRVIPAFEGAGLLSHLHLFANNSATRLVYTADNKLDLDRTKAHSRKYGITPEHGAIMREVLAQVVPEFIWGSQASLQGVEARSHFDNLVQVTIRRFTTQERRISALGEIRQAFAEAGIGSDVYQVTTGGRAGIDINNAQVDKSLALRIMLKEQGLIDSIFYFGDEFTILSDDPANPAFGNDMSVLDIAEVIAFAVNADQTTVPSHERLIAAGAGPEATLAVLCYFSLIGGLNA